MRFFNRTKPLEPSFLPGFVSIQCDCGSILHVNKELLSSETGDCQCGTQYAIVDGKAVKVDIPKGSQSQHPVL